MNARIHLLLIAAIAGITGCGDSLTGSQLSEIQSAQANWTSHNLGRYAYRYTTTGFFNAFDGRQMRLVVLTDTVRSAQFVATNDSVCRWCPPRLPTIPTRSLPLHSPRTGMVR